MALAIKLPQDRKRVKVYELRDNDWFDRGTGFCTGAIVEVSLSDAITVAHRQPPKPMLARPAATIFIAVLRVCRNAFFVISVFFLFASIDFIFSWRSRWF
jgi:hypothetical protein